MNEIKSVSVFGLGKLGHPLAITMANRGFTVTGIDIDPGCMIPSMIDGLRYSFGADQALGTDASFFCVPTPSNSDGSFSEEYLWQAMEGLAVELKKVDKTGHLFVCCSTTTPGGCSKLHKMISDIVGWDNFGFCYNPQFIALGSVEFDLLNPDLVLIGEMDKGSGDMLSGFYAKYNNTVNPCRMSLISAELAKIALNSYITTKISFTNQIRMIAEKLGGDTHAILEALGRDTRIGPEYLRPGLSYGGPCFPRDNRLLSYVGRQIGVDAALAEAADSVNDSVKEDLLCDVISHRTEFVVVLGLAYKPGTPITDESAGLYLASELSKLGRSVLVHDPMAGTEGFRTLETLAELRVMTGGLVVVCTDWPEYRNLEVHPSMKVINPYDIHCSH